MYRARIEPSFRHHFPQFCKSLVPLPKDIELSKVGEKVIKNSLRLSFIPRLTLYSSLRKLGRVTSSLFLLATATFVTKKILENLAKYRNPPIYLLCPSSSILFYFLSFQSSTTWETTPRSADRLHPPTTTAHNQTISRCTDRSSQS